MSTADRDSGSFRDPGGYIFSFEGRIIRAVTSFADQEFADVYNDGIIKKLEDEKLMIPCKRLDVNEELLQYFKGARSEDIVSLYEHPRIPFISYPYEWSFSQLKDAALAHLRAQIFSLKQGFEFSDASAYNIQFVEGQPIHIDAMSLRKYSDGAHWIGYNQFCRQFLLPLLLEAWAGVSFQSLYRGNISGITFEDALAILPKTKVFTSISGVLHVYLHGKAVTSSSSNSSESTKKISDLPKSRYLALLEQLIAFISSLNPSKRPQSYWKSYANKNSYSDEMRAEKLLFVKSWATESNVETIWDIGGNTGDFSLAALEGGAKFSIILDSDHDSIDYTYRSRTKVGVPIFPILTNVTDPAPDTGWRLRERRSIFKRSSPDGIIALAVIHHMCITNNIPLFEALGWLLNLAPTGIIEFVPKKDPMVRRLLNTRKDIFHDYNEENFRATILEKHEILREHKFHENGRIIVSYKRKAP